MVNSRKGEKTVKKMFKEVMDVIKVRKTLKRMDVIIEEIFVPLNMNVIMV